MRIDKIQTSGTFKTPLEDISIQQRICPKLQLHPASRQTIKYGTVRTQEETNNVLDHNALQIYTDGSKQETGECGAAFVILQRDGRWETRKFKLHHLCKVFQAEVFAIDCALAWAQTNPDESRLQLFCDSQSCLEAIKDRSNTMPLIVSIHERLFQLRLTHSIHFYWIKAHVGIEGNELADSYAIKAAAPLDDMAFTQCAICSVNSQIRSETAAYWQQEYLNAPNGSTTKTFFQSPEDAKVYTQRFGVSFVMTQFLTGHGFHKTYLKRFNIVDNDSGVDLCQIL
ncbi:uncharacterized protein LOC118739781 [Rhagoletis pomonella]|uniref:uncharacterized protein LOC118739781 n=1 Tax=Rhagoletis pomonella TaxID=28610 RepID=UPI001780B5FD|nr:uncharacterized protein LOC118739781 [Rhagoletis pomonella]